MIIAVIGDTHDQIQELKTLVTRLTKQNIDYLIHAGDWVSAFTLEYYKPIKCPIRGVWGNNIGDHRFPALAEKNGIDLQIEEELSLELGGKRIRVLHELTNVHQGADVLVYGHDHKANIEHRDGVLCLNPGTLLRETFPWLKSTPSYILYDTETNHAELFSLE